MKAHGKGFHPMTRIRRKRSVVHWLLSVSLATGLVRTLPTTLAGGEDLPSSPSQPDKALVDPGLLRVLSEIEPALKDGKKPATAKTSAGASTKIHAGSPGTNQELLKELEAIEPAISNPKNPGTSSTAAPASNGGLILTPPKPRESQGVPAPIGPGSTPAVVKPSTATPSFAELLPLMNQPAEESSAKAADSVKLPLIGPAVPISKPTNPSAKVGQAPVPVPAIEIIPVAPSTGRPKTASTPKDAGTAKSATKPKSSAVATKPRATSTSESTTSQTAPKQRDRGVVRTQSAAANVPPPPAPGLPAESATPEPMVPLLTESDITAGGVDPQNYEAIPGLTRANIDSGGMSPNRPSVRAMTSDPSKVGAQINEVIEFVQDANAELNVVVGRSKLIQLKKVPLRVMIANPTVASFTYPPNVDRLDLNERKLYALTGHRFGSTTLTIFDQDGKPITFLIRATIDTADLEERLRQTFPGADVRIRQIADNLILDGQVPDTKTMFDVITIVRAVSNIESIGGTGVGGGAVAGGASGAQGGPGGGGGAVLAGAANEGQNLAAGGVGSLTSSGGAGGGGGGAIGGTGSPTTEAGAFGEAEGNIPQIINRLTLPGNRQIMLKVRIAEISRTALRQIGSNFLRIRDNSIMGSVPDSSVAGLTGSVNGTQASSFMPRRFTQAGLADGLFVPRSTQGAAITGIDTALQAAATAANGTSSQLFGIFDAGEFSIFVNALRSNGLGKILAEPTLVTLDGQAARFIAGGEVPIVASGLGAASVSYRPFGSVLTFLPMILQNNIIRLDVEPSFSQPGEVGAGGNPTFNTRSARTVVELKKGQTLVLAGLLETRTRSSIVRIPLLGDIPVLGTAFSRNVIQTEESELVVMVTPELVAPLDKDQVPPVPGDLVGEPTDVEFYFLGRSEGRTGKPHRATIQHLDPFHFKKHKLAEDHYVPVPHGYDQ